MDKPSSEEQLLTTKPEENDCSEHKELRKDKKYISKIQQILSYHDKASPFHVLIVLTFREKDCVGHIAEIYDLLRVYPIKFFLDNRSYSDFQAFLQENKRSDLSLADFTEFDADFHSKIIDVVITIGGDGIILKSASFFPNRPTPPMITFEKEIHGFLQNFAVRELKPALSRIFTGLRCDKEIYVEKKMRIQATILKRNANKVEEVLSFAALNEIIVDRGPSPMCVKSEIFINNKLLTTNFGDGIIISSPTGSTAYAISANGPIIHNYVRSLNIVPICPHSLSFRPLVVPSDCVIRIKTSLDSRANAFISSDGKRIFELSNKHELVITESLYDAHSKITDFL